MESLSRLLNLWLLNPFLGPNRLLDNLLHCAVLLVLRW
jgi:hypothetical protein